MPSIVSSLIFANGYDPNNPDDVEKFYKEQGEQFPDEGLQWWLNEWTGNNPPRNVWLGTSVENQETADQRIPELLKVPAKVRFLSCEPLLGEIRWLTADNETERSRVRFEGTDHEWRPSCCIDTQIDWVIVGGESGPNARPMHPEWAQQIRKLCNAACIPFFFKQWGEWSPIKPDAGGVRDWGLIDWNGKFFRQTTAWNGRTGDESETWEVYVYPVGKKKSGRLLDGREWNEFPEVAN
jgi:protein gp37